MQQAGQPAQVTLADVNRSTNDKLAGFGWERVLLELDLTTGML